MLKNHRSPQKFEQQSKARFPTAMWLDVKISILYTPFYISEELKYLGFECQENKKGTISISLRTPDTEVLLVQTPKLVSSARVNRYFTKQIQSMYFLFVPSFFRHLIDYSLETTKRFSIIFWPCGLLLDKLHIKSLIMSALLGHLLIQIKLQLFTLTSLISFFIMQLGWILHQIHNFMFVDTSIFQNLEVTPLTLPPIVSVCVCTLNFVGLCCDSMYCGLQAPLFMRFSRQKY